LKASTAISTVDIEKILSSGKVPMTGIRNHIIGAHAERIEKLAAEAKSRVFEFNSNSIWIWTAYSEPSAVEDHPYSDMLTGYGEQRLFGPKSTLLHQPSYRMVTFDPVRVDWPAFVEAAQEAGFDIPRQPNPGATANNQRESQTALTDPENPVTKQRRGPKPGTLRRFASSDRALFDELEQLMGKELSLTAAARELAKDGKIKGVGISTLESRATRLAKLYREERLRTR
jgi:hypothetical protein